LAEDEASLYLQATTRAVWAVRGQPPEVKLSADRDKTNFFGTLNLHNGQELVLRTEQMTGSASIQHLEQVLTAYPTQHIVLFWDRASWHKGALVREFLKEHERLEVIYFPVSAPEMNPQEHVWKAARQAVSHNHPPAKLDQVADQFECHLAQNTFESSFLFHYGFDAIDCTIFI
jgi:transposase